MSAPLAALFASGHVVDLALGLLLAEAAALAVLRRPALGRAVPFLVAGACLLLALRAALVGAWWGWVALWLACGGVAHGFDLRSRWRAADAK